MRSLTRYAEEIKKYAPKWIYKIGSQSYIDKRFPRHLFIETTAKCNLTCSYCPRERVDDHMEFELFKSIVKEATKYGPRSFSLHLFGEPLLWPHIVEGIRFIKQCNKRHVVLLTTNGTHLNHFAGDLIKEKVDEIIWTWRPEARFKSSTKQALLEATRRGTTKFRARIIKEITPKEAREEWQTWPKVEIRSLHNYGGEIDLSRWNAPNAGTRHPCYHLWFAPAVAWNGNMLLCCVDPHQKYVLGNVKKQKISEIWQGSKINTERQNHLAGIYQGICKNCDVWKSYPDIFFKWQRRTG